MAVIPAEVEEILVHINAVTSDLIRRMDVSQLSKLRHATLGTYPDELGNAILDHMDEQIDLRLFPEDQENT